MITVNMRTNTATITNRRLPTSTGISVFGKITGASGIGAILTSVRLTIPETGFFQDTQTNAFGDYAFYFLTPSFARRLTLRIVATFTLAGQETQVVPVIVGDLIGNPSDPSDPESTDLLGGIGETAKTVLMVLAWGVVIVGLVYLLPYLLPKIKAAFAR